LGEAPVQPERHLAFVDFDAMIPSLIAGVFSGIAGLLVFLLIHHFWITPIWFILPLGLVIAGTGGAVVGWAYTELLPGLPSRPWTALAMFALILVILLPALILAELRRPLFDISGSEAVLSLSIGRAAVIFVLELLVTAASVGGIAGLLIGHTWRAALSTALAGLIFALGPGHNIPLIGGTPGVGKEVVIMIAIISVSALVLVETHRLLTGT
jgi:hypothetical protein